VSEPDTSSALPPAGRYRFDPQHTFAQSAVRHMVVGRVDGRFDPLFEAVREASKLSATARE
jgi:polyisoprenoid-binding protein YceI